MWQISHMLTWKLTPLSQFGHIGIWHLSWIVMHKQLGVIGLQISAAGLRLAHEKRHQQKWWFQHSDHTELGW